MTTKEKLKREIDKLPDELLDQVYQYVNSITTKRKRRKKIHTFKLQGQYDNINIREKAYD